MSNDLGSLEDGQQAIMIGADGQPMPGVMAYKQNGIITIDIQHRDQAKNFFDYIRDTDTDTLAELATTGGVSIERVNAAVTSLEEEREEDGLELTKREKVEEIYRQLGFELPAIVDEEEFGEYDRFLTAVAEGTYRKGFSFTEEKAEEKGSVDAAAEQRLRDPEEGIDLKLMLEGGFAMHKLTGFPPGQILRMMQNAMTLYEVGTEIHEMWRNWQAQRRRNNEAGEDGPETEAGEPTASATPDPNASNADANATGDNDGGGDDDGSTTATADADTDQGEEITDATLLHCDVELFTYEVLVDGEQVEADAPPVYVMEIEPGEEVLTTLAMLDEGVEEDATLTITMTKNEKGKLVITTDIIEDHPDADRLVAGNANNEIQVILEDIDGGTQGTEEVRELLLKLDVTPQQMREALEETLGEGREEHLGIVVEAPEVDVDISIEEVPEYTTSSTLSDDVELRYEYTDVDSPERQVGDNDSADSRTGRGVTLNDGFGYDDIHTTTTLGEDVEVVFVDGDLDGDGKLDANEKRIKDGGNADIPDAPAPKPKPVSSKGGGGKSLAESLFEHVVPGTTFTAAETPETQTEPVERSK